MKILRSVKSKLTTVFYSVITFVATHKITSAVILAIIAGVVATAIIISGILSAPSEIISSGGGKISDTFADAATSEPTESEPVVSAPIIEEVISSEETPVSSQEEPVSSEETITSGETQTAAPQPVNPTPQYNPNSIISYDNNVFLDALKYTGYKTDPRMWGSYGNYVLCSRKAGLGWLSEITYDDYGSASGYETNEQGLPDIHYFTYRSNGTKRGLVCASYAAYVYFNYLPNVVGIDTSMLARPDKSYSANDWYIAAKKWVDAGYSRYIEFSADDGGSINRDIKFEPHEEIPIGSIMVMCDWYNRSQYGSHVSIYAGEVNGYHWVTHVGNENGPELCAMERMNRKPHPQWPIAIITTPSNIRFSATVEVAVNDQDGNAVSDIEISIKHIPSGTVTNLGKTNLEGKVSKDGLSYGEYEVMQTVPTDYVCDNSVQIVNFTAANNSLNTVSFTNNKIQSNQTDASESEILE